MTIQQIISCLYCTYWNINQINSWKTNFSLFRDLHNWCTKKTRSCSYKGRSFFPCIFYATSYGTVTSFSMSMLSIRRFYICYSQGWERSRVWFDCCSTRETYFGWLRFNLYSCILYCILNSFTNYLFYSILIITNMFMVLHLF